MKRYMKYWQACLAIPFIALASNIACAGQWMDCTPYRVAVRDYGDMHIGCENIAGWYYIKSTSKNKDYIDRVLYLGTSAIISKKSLKLEVAKPGNDSEIISIELFK